MPSVGIASIEGNLQYITDPPVRTQAGKLLDELKTWKTGHILIDAIKDAISIKVNGRVFAYFYPRRKHFIIATYSSEDDWTDYPVEDDNDLQATLPLMRAAMERKSTQE